MPIKHTPGATTITGDSQHFFRLAALKGAVRLELAGIKVRRGPAVWRGVKAEFGLKAKNGREVFDWLVAELDRLRPLQEHVTVENGREIREVGGREIN